MTPAENATADGKDLRQRYTDAIHYVLYGPHTGDTTQRLAATAAHAVLAVRDEELDRLHVTESALRKASEDLRGAHIALNSETSVRIAAAAAVARVRELHSRLSYDGKSYCELCSKNDYPNYQVLWPCPTIRALDGTEAAT